MTNPSEPTLSAARKTVAVVGASSNRSKFGNKSVRAHVAQGWQVFPVHPTAEVIEGLPAFRTVGEIPVPRLDRVTVYVPPHIGVELLEDFASKYPMEVWLNPGAASASLVARAEALRLPIIQACSIVDLGINPSNLD